MRNVFFERHLTALCQRDASGGLALQIGNSNRHVTSEALKPLGLLNHHRVAKVHLTAWHQTRQNAEWKPGTVCLEDLVNITMSKDDTSSMKFGGVWKARAFEGCQTKLLDDAIVIG